MIKMFTDALKIKMFIRALKFTCLHLSSMVIRVFTTLHLSSTVIHEFTTLHLSSIVIQVARSSALATRSNG